jgi:NADH:ubiquinone oxidoreductase subunit 6 (subunit J)
MLIDLEKYPNNTERSKIKLIITVLTSLVSLGVLALIINNNIDTITVVNLSDSSMKALFDRLFTQYYIPFELATVLLLAAVVAVVVIANNDKQHPGKE